MQSLATAEFVLQTSLYHLSLPVLSLPFEVRPILAPGPCNSIQPDPELHFQFRNLATAI